MLLTVASIAAVVYSPAFAQVKLSKSTSAGRAVHLQGYARSDPSCAGLDPPEILIEQPPQHGIVCLRRDKMMLDGTIENNLKHCLGRIINGFFVTYLPRRGYVGSDHVLYTVRFPTTQHMVQFDVKVLPFRPGSFAEPKDISDPIDEKVQMPGPIPLCAVPVS
jgi:hypothetical protein